VVGIVLATFFSDVGHEMVTAVLPLYLTSIALGPAALGVMEGFADLLFSGSKLLGGWVGHHTDKKRVWGTLGYFATMTGTVAIALVQTLAALVTLRGIAWFGRGFRSPLRDFLLADEVGSTHFGRAYGIERAADMLGAVSGPLIAVALLWLGIDFKTVILVSIVPSAAAVASFFFMTRDRPAPPTEARATASKRLPPQFWMFTAGVGLFGLGDFSRTFLIFLAAAALGEASHAPGTLSVAVLLYAAHNGISALAAYPAGALGDRGSKLKVLCVGYALGVVTNGLLAFTASSILWLSVAIALSGIYIAIQETLEKASAASFLPREQRSFGLGILASANAVGDMASSLFVGFMLHAGHTTLAFLVPAALGFLGTLWMAWFTSQFRDTEI
jgi:MFS family permease